MGVSDPVKLIREPRVYVLASQRINGSQLAAFLEDHGAESWQPDPAAGDAQTLVEIAGRLCYLSYSKPRPGGNSSYINHILEVGHGSVTEHAVWSLIVTGVSRSLSHELVRHRVGISPSQLSQRYVDSSDVAFVVPPELLGDAKVWEDHQGEPVQYQDDWVRERIALFRIWLDACGRARDAYAALVRQLAPRIRLAKLEEWRRRLAPVPVEGGILENFERDEKTNIRKEARQTARSVLPNATETKLFLSGNARSFRNLIELRASNFADVEIRRLANRIYEVLLAEAPALFSDYLKVDLPDGTYELTTPHKKV